MARAPALPRSHDLSRTLSTGGGIGIIKKRKLESGSDGCETDSSVTELPVTQPAGTAKALASLQPVSEASGEKGVEGVEAPADVSVEVAPLPSLPALLLLPPKGTGKSAIAAATEKPSPRASAPSGTPRRKRGKMDAKNGEGPVPSPGPKSAAGTSRKRDENVRVQGAPLLAVGRASRWGGARARAPHGLARGGCSRERGGGLGRLQPGSGWWVPPLRSGELRVGVTLALLNPPPAPACRECRLTGRHSGWVDW